MPALTPLLSTCCHRSQSSSVEYPDLFTPPLPHIVISHHDLPANSPPFFGATLPLSWSRTYLFLRCPPASQPWRHSPSLTPISHEAAHHSRWAANTLSSRTSRLQNYSLCCLQDKIQIPQWTLMAWPPKKERKKFLSTQYLLNKWLN